MIELQEAGGVYMVVKGTGGRVVEAVVCEVCSRNVSVFEPPCLTAFIMYMKINSPAVCRLTSTISGDSIHERHSLHTARIDSFQSSNSSG